MNVRTARLALATALVLGGLGACSSDDDAAGPGGPTTAPAPTELGSPTEPDEPGEPLTILVTNDDGYDALGIDAVVEGLLTLDDVEVIVVAPRDQRSLTAGATTEGELEVTDVTTASGVEARAVDGYPADSVRVAIDDLGIEPDLVVSGINEGQNIGPLIDRSGTIGGARAGVARGVPALAVSHGLGSDLAYETGVPFVLDWIEERREALLAGEAPVVVTSINVPECTEGELRGLLEVEPDQDGPGGQALAPQDCTSEVPADDLATDLEAFVEGFATIAVVPSEPRPTEGE